MYWLCKEKLDKDDHLLWVLHFYFKYDFRRNLKHFGFSTIGLKNQRQNIETASLTFPTQSLTNLLKIKSLLHDIQDKR